MEERRYQVVTWCNDIGSDEKMDYNRFSFAVADAEAFRKTEEYAAVYDRYYKIAFVIFGDPTTPVFADTVLVTTMNF